MLLCTDSSLSVAFLFLPSFYLLPSILFSVDSHLLALRGDPRTSGSGTSARADVGITALSLERPFDTLHAMLLNANIGGSFTPDSPVRDRMKDMRIIDD